MMAKKPISLFVLAAFLLFNASCLVPGRPVGFQKTVKEDPVNVNRTDIDLRIVNVVTKSGKDISFREKAPGRFLRDGSAVVGVTPQEVTVLKPDVKVFTRNKSGKIGKIETADGRVYKVRSGIEDAEKVVFIAEAPITIPFEDIQQVWIRKADVTANVVVAVLAVGATVALAFALAHSLSHIEAPPAWESCPFIYSFNGEEYVLDAEPYGMAVSEGLKRTDWVELSNLRIIDGRYRVLLANELNETQYTDELKLTVVDHPKGVAVAPDIAGKMHTYLHPVSPTRAFDQKGRDILTFVAATDRVFWVSRLEEKSPEDGDMRDELVFEFPKPAGAKLAKLRANAWTTQWGSLSAGRFLRLFGSSLPERYADVDRLGPTYRRFVSWMANEELYTMKVWVETPSGWQARGMIFGGAPVIAKDKTYLLDVGDIPGDVLRVKLRPPVNFWMLNSLAVEYGEDLPVDVTELAVAGAVDPLRRNVKEVLAATDGSYLTSATKGERTELLFAAPPLKAGRERTVFAKTSGYYRINVPARGEPQTELIERVLGEPGFAARYSFREYLKWEAGLRAQAAR
jgi:hypothetical protein